MSFLTPIAFLGGLIAIPILLLYMLRLRRQERVISSNFLWEQVVRDREANTPWQRLRRNWLLILQLMILALLVLALARPAQVVPTITAGKTVILLDASASMRATDIDGRTRFQQAQTEAIQILADAGARDEISIIRVAEVTEPLISYTDDFGALRQTVSDAQVGYGPGDWETALTLAAAGAEGADAFQMIIISDGGVGTTARLPENIPQPLYVPIGNSRDNLAISALAARALPGQAPQLFAQVQNYALTDHEVSLLIRLDGDIWQSTTQTVSANSQRSFVFNIDRPYTTISAELVLEARVVDHLDIDNQAYTVANTSQTRRILYASDAANLFIEQALRSLPDVQAFQWSADNPTLPAETYDLYIFDGYLPDVLPAGDMLIINPPRSTPLFSLGETIDRTRPIELVDRGHPLATFLNLENVNLRRFRELSAITWADTIATANRRPIIIAGARAGQQVIVMPFNLNESDFGLQIAFPLFIFNALDWFAPATIVASGTTYSVGDIVRITPPLDSTRVRITHPDGRTDRLQTPQGAPLSFSDTRRPGLYRIETLTGDTVTETQIIAVNSFGTGESDIAPVSDSAIVQVGGGTATTAPDAQLGFREFGSALAALALLVLLYEWHVHHRRLRPPRRDDDDPYDPRPRNRLQRIAATLQWRRDVHNTYRRR
jgi:Ca-activated chloride channel homolog